MATKWSTADQVESLRQGWGLFREYDPGFPLKIKAYTVKAWGLAVEFANDAEAVAFVGLADTDLKRKALTVLKEWRADA